MQEQATMVCFQTARSLRCTMLAFNIKCSALGCCSPFCLVRRETTPTSGLSPQPFMFSLRQGTAGAGR